MKCQPDIHSNYTQTCDQHPGNVVRIGFCRGCPIFAVFVLPLGPLAVGLWPRILMFPVSVIRVTGKVCTCGGMCSVKVTLLTPRISQIGLIPALGMAKQSRGV